MYAFITPEGYIRKVLAKPDPRDNPRPGEIMLPYTPPEHDPDLVSANPIQPILGTEILFTLEPHPNAAERVTRTRIAQIQQHLDTEAQKRGYDNIISAVSYSIDMQGPFHQEGMAFARWRSECWKKAFEILDEVEKGQRAIPSKGELISLLPEVDL